MSNHDLINDEAAARLVDRFGGRERPILFSAPMVRALLGGSKTQTRRVAKVPANATDVRYWAPPSGRSQPGWADPGLNYWTPDASGATLSNHLDPCPYGQPGDRLWVRETFAKIEGQTRPWIETDYRATYTHGDRLGDLLGIKKRWTPSIHMPRAASRITLEVAGLRVERLQDISRGDAMAEGCPFPNMAQGDDPRQWYADLWSEINGPDSWTANPWVWVVEFKRVQP